MVRYRSLFRITEDTREQLRGLCFYLRMSRVEVIQHAVNRYYYNDDTKPAKMRSNDDGRYPIDTKIRISLRTKDQLRALTYHLRMTRNEVLKNAVERYYKDEISK